MCPRAAALAVACLLAAHAGAATCAGPLRLTVDPPEKTAAVAATLTRRLQTAGLAGSVEADGAGLRATLPPGADVSLLTRPARIEFRIVAPAADTPGAVALANAQGGRDYVQPEIVVDESHLRGFTVADDGTIAFRFDPHAIKNMMSATAEAVGGKLAIIVDDIVVAEPIIRAPVATTSGEIDAGLSPASARQLAALLPDGRLAGRVAVAPCAAP